MRMVNYYSVLVLLLAPALLLTLWSGIQHDASDRHLAIGFLTAILCVATQTLLILFMIITGRVLKAAMKVRPLDPKYLTELNEFFAKHKAYPVATLAAFMAAATAVLGYGSHIGVPPVVHMLLGLLTLLLNAWAISIGLKTLRSNQTLLDRVSTALDDIEEEIGPAAEEDGEIEWVVGPSPRYFIYALSAWLPYLYWGLVVWKGDFGRVADTFLYLTALVFVLGLLAAWRTRNVVPTGES